MTDKAKNDMTKFKNIIRNKADHDRSFYAIVQILKKIKFKHKGTPTVDKPVFTVLFNVVESNLPIPANAYNPVFMFKRANPELVLTIGGPGPDKWTPQESGDDYIGTPSPEQYLTLPDYDNNINSDAVVERGGKKVIGDYYLAPMFIKTFDSHEVADAFVGQVMDDLKGFLAAMTNYMKEKHEIFDWEWFDLGGATKDGSETKHMHKVVASFTEKGGSDIQPDMDRVREG